MKRGHPGGSKVRKGKLVGPDYPAELYRNPFGGGVDKESGSWDEKTLKSPSDTIEGLGKMNGDYDKYWEGK